MTVATGMKLDESATLLAWKTGVSFCCRGRCPSVTTWDGTGDNCGHRLATGDGTGDSCVHLFSSYKAWAWNTVVLLFAKGDGTEDNCVHLLATGDGTGKTLACPIC
jgi:hypothetical protein